MIFLIIVFEIIARRFPLLKMKLRQAGMKEKPEEFVKKTIVSSFYMSTGILVFLFLVLAKIGVARMLVFIFPVIFLFLFSYLLRIPDVKIRKVDRGISKEIVFAGRFLIIELQSGVSLHNALSNLSKNYLEVGKYFKEVTDKVSIGTPMEDALNEAVELSPSDNFRRVIWQILNSLRTGSDIATSLSAVLDQISREQNIEIERYGKKLNPLAMFYMIIAVILPSLGITMLIILSTFIGFELNLAVLLFISFFLGFIQFLFLALIKFSRPAVEL